MNLQKFSTFHRLIQVTSLARIQILTSCMSVTSSSTAPLFTSSSKFVLNLNQIHFTFWKTYTLNFCKVSGEITKFSMIFCGMSWFFVAYSSGEITYIHRFKKFQKDVGLFVGKFSVRLLINGS